MLKMLVWGKQCRMRQLPLRGLPVLTLMLLLPLMLPPPPLAPILEAWLPRCGSDWLFPGVRLQRPWTGGSPGEKPLDQLQAAGREIGLEAVTFQMLRHTFATHAASWGIGPIHLKQILRHTTLRTQRHYIHEDPEGLRRAADRVRFGPSPN